MRLASVPLDQCLLIETDGGIFAISPDDPVGFLEELQALGCPYVLLDSFYGDVEATRNHETTWRMLTTVAEQALDLAKETVK